MRVRVSMPSERVVLECHPHPVDLNFGQFRKYFQKINAFLREFSVKPYNSCDVLEIPGDQQLVCETLSLA